MGRGSNRDISRLDSESSEWEGELGEGTSSALASKGAPQALTLPLREVARLILRA